MGQKRRRDPKGSALQSKKKTKGSSTHVSNGNESGDEIVGMNDLNWSSVDLPDRMEDTEGFFGLEEIEGVDIVRPDGIGEIKFKAKPGKPKNSILKQKSAEESGSDDEWSGFGDDDDDAVDGDATEDVPVTEDDKGQDDTKRKPKAKDAKPEESQETGKKEKKEKKNPKREAKAKLANNADKSIKPGLSFAALQDEEEDDGVDVSEWESLGLAPEILTSLSKMKFSTPTTVQKSCIPQILKGHDVVGKASTGSGKTLAFGIPLLQHYLERRRDREGKKSDKTERPPLALILSPTRELAHQLAKHIGELNNNAPGANARIALLTGGLSVQKQQRLLVGADIVIGTPGRLWEVLRTGTGLIRKMQQIKYVVVDEADRLLSQGHFKEATEILDALDRVEVDETPEGEEAASEEENPRDERQTLVFSATFHRDLQQKLAGKGQWSGGDVMSTQESMEYLLKKLNFREEKPKFIDANPASQMAEGLKEGIVECPAMEKDLYLYTLMLYHPKHRTLVFTNSISAVRRLTQLLQALKLPALALHSSMAQKARLRSVEKFSSPTADPGSILVATDVAARGLDIKGIEFVVHYHAPRAADAYVHRSGRTARAGASGKSVIICSPEEMTSVIRLAAKVHARRGDAKSMPLESLELDRRVVGRVKQRVVLASKLTESNIAKEKITAEDNWLRKAAEDLGVDYDSDDLEDAQSRPRGRGGGREQRQREAGSVSKAELAGIRAELNHLLSQRVNVGVSEKYLTSGRVDIEALLRGEGNQSFLGQVDPLGF